MREGVEKCGSVREGRLYSEVVVRARRFERGRGHNSRTTVELRSEVTLRKCGSKPAHFCQLHKFLTTKYTVRIAFLDLPLLILVLEL